ncbi:hypothetical protein BJX99DRAFT_270063 [Aspergillus californicus]
MAQPPSTNTDFRIAIAGAGIAGLTAAIALLRLLPPNVSVTIFERATKLEEVGASIGISPNGLRSLYKLGIDPTLIDASSFRQPSGSPFIYVHWLTGEVLKRTVHQTVTDPRDAMARFHRAHLQKLLLESLPEGVSLELNKRVESVRIDPAEGRDGVLLAFQDGTTFAADLLVGADGIHSAVRRNLVQDHSLRWTGDVLFRSAFDISYLEGVKDLPEDAVFYCGPNGRYLFASKLGKNQYTVVGGSQSDPDDPQNPHKDTKWNTEADMASLRALYKGWHPIVSDLLNATPSTRAYPNHLGTPLKSLVFGSHAALIGDAGHTHGGAFASGGSLAINDAHALALSLAYVWPKGDHSKPDSSQVARALALFDATRRPHVNRLVEIVHSGLAARQEKLRSTHRVEETDSELRERIAEEEDIGWLAEHDVESTFAAITRAEVTARL